MSSLFLTNAAVVKIAVTVLTTNVRNVMPKVIFTVVISSSGIFRNMSR